MLGPELVRARRRGDKLHVSELSSKDRNDALALASLLLDTVRDAGDSSREDLSEALAQIPRTSRQEKLLLGLKKLVLDHCEFAHPLSGQAVSVRQAVFTAAAETRRNLGLSENFDRQQVLAKVARGLNLEAAQVETALFADLKNSQRLLAPPALSPELLVAEYELAQVQGVLLRASRVTAEIECFGPDELRALFSKLKFRNLLFRIEPLGETTYRVEMEGPFSLFESVTKYGLQLALVIPVLFASGAGKLNAQLIWGKERRRLTYEKTWKTPAHSDAQMVLRSEVAGLLLAVNKRKSPWRARQNDRILEIPGQGLCIPDLVFESEKAEPVYFEMLGFWSRDAAFSRIKWAQSGKHARLIIALSSRLRVSQELLDEQDQARLYVFKSAISASKVLALVESLSP